MSSRPQTSKTIFWVTLLLAVLDDAFTNMPKDLIGILSCFGMLVAIATKLIFEHES